MQTPNAEGEQLLTEMIQFMGRFRKNTWRSLSSVMAGCPKCHFDMLEPLHFAIEQAGQNGAVCVSELVGRMHGAPPAVSRSLRALECEGLIRRYADPADRRRTLVELTEKGEALRRQNETCLTQYLSRVMARLGPDNINRILDDWRMLEQALEAEASIQNGKRGDSAQC